MADELKAAEQRAYGRGYAAGQKRAKRNADSARLKKMQDAAWNRAFISALQERISTQGWTVGDKPIANIADRVRLARDFANEAIKHMRFP